MHRFNGKNCESNKYCKNHWKSTTIKKKTNKWGVFAPQYNEYFFLYSFAKQSERPLKATIGRSGRCRCLGGRPLGALPSLARRLADLTWLQVFVADVVDIRNGHIAPLLVLFGQNRQIFRVHMSFKALIGATIKRANQIYKKKGKLMEMLHENIIITKTSITLSLIITWC